MIFYILGCLRSVGTGDFTVTSSIDGLDNNDNYCYDNVNFFVWRSKKHNEYFCTPASYNLPYEINVEFGHPFLLSNIVYGRCTANNAPVSYNPKSVQFYTGQYGVLGSRTGDTWTINVSLLANINSDIIHSFYLNVGFYRKKKKTVTTEPKIH